MPGTDRVRYRYYSAYDPAKPNVAPAWITLPAPVVTALHDKGLVEFGERTFGTSEFSDWQEAVRVTERGRLMLEATD